MSCRRLLLLIPLIALPLGCVGNRAATTSHRAAEPVERVAASSAAHDDSAEESSPFWQNSWLDRLKRAPRIPLPLTGSDPDSEVQSAGETYGQLDEVDL